MDDCWLYAGWLDKDGYGNINIYLGLGKTTSVKAHRVMYENTIGDIPDGLYLDHLCFTPTCINPKHLEPVTNKENLRRGLGIAGSKFRQTECIHGHLFDEKNTRIRPNGTRACRKCHAIRNHNRYHR